MEMFIHTLYSINCVHFLLCAYIVEHTKVIYKVIEKLMWRIGTHIVEITSR